MAQISDQHPVNEVEDFSNSERWSDDMDENHTKVTTENGIAECSDSSEKVQLSPARELTEAEHFDARVKDKKLKPDANGVNSDDETVSTNENDHRPRQDHDGSRELSEIDRQWVFLQNVPDIMQCNICCNVFESPQLLTCCSRSICKTCIEKYFRRAEALVDKNRACPFCREVDYRMINNTSLEESINELKVQCRYKDNGCGWYGSLQNGKLHLKECDFMPIDCPNNCGSVKFERCKLAKHFQECPLQSMRCSFEAVGCDKDSFLKRKEARKHQRDNLHHHLLLVAKLGAKTLQEYKTLSASVHSEIDRTCKEKSISSHDYNSVESTKLAVESLKSNLKETQDRIQMLKQEIKKEEICVAELRKKVRQTKSSEEAYKGTVAQISALRTPEYRGIRYPPTTFTIQNFSKWSTVGEKWISPPFYTHRGGYKFCLSVLPNHRKHVSVSLHIMMGEYDDHLKWPFPGAIFTVMAIKQDYNSCNRSVHIRVSGEETIHARLKQIDGALGYGVGVGDFLDRNMLSPYVTRNDSLNIQVYNIQFPL